MRVCVFATVCAAVATITSGLPSMRDSMTNPVHVYEGDDALITCVVRDIGDNTIMWKKEDRERHSRRVLTAGETRVTADKRFSVLHDGSQIEGPPGTDAADLPSGGDVWVLVIKNSKPSDSGIYVCEVNSNPIVRSFHKLSVLSRALLPPDNTTDPNLYQEKEIFAHSHNYTDCCTMHNVSQHCLGFCNIQSILEGNTGQDPENCEADFPSIVKCMADGRNHVPCCIQENVPDICQDVCRGEYTVITDNIKTHFSCSAYTEQTLACIVEGIELLPSPPENVQVEGLTEKSLKVSWSFPITNTETVTEYAVNITSLHGFDSGIYDPEETALSTTPAPISTHSVQVNVRSTENSTIINNLSPFTMYEVTVSALNSHGSSLPSYAVRSLTLTPGKMKPTAVVESPQLPDIKACCTAKGVNHKTCLDKLCDPNIAVATEIPDLMICAPWAADTFTCLTNGLDHTPCCKARGLPELCQQLCTGNVTQIDFSFFKCLRYMGEYTNCLLQGYGVLPSAPTKLHIANVNTNFAIIDWFPPFILDELESDTKYEVFVDAANTHGVGEPSSRVLFLTRSKVCTILELFQKFQSDQSVSRIYK